MDDLLYEPLKYYEQKGKPSHEENTTQYFNDLLAASGVSEEENRATVAAYKKELENVQQAEKRISKFKTYRTLLIIGIIVGAIMLLSSFGKFSDAVGVAIILLLLGLGMAVGFIYLLVKKVNPLIKDSSAFRDSLQAKANELLEQAKAQMAPLNALFDNVDTFRIIEKTIPEFSFDNRFTKDHEAFFTQTHDFLDLSTDETTMVNTLAGRFAGNPFLYCQRIIHEMGTATYSGSLTITWTETYYSNGRLQTRTRTQTLHASVEKPKPYFHNNTYLCYGNQAAPDLSFSRTPQHSERLSEKELQKKVKAGEKALQKEARKAIKAGESFQEMANTEFEVLFGATDRDQEVQFRLMYTPLGQRNTMDLVKNHIGYGDDFRFNKARRFNVIATEHSQGWDMSTAPSHYYSYDVDDARLKFMNFNVNYFKSMFFDFAPLFSVPVYLEEPCASLEPIEDYNCNYTYYEHEVMANAIGQTRFVHPDSRTQAILKTQLIQRQGETDVVNVTAASYTTIDRIDYVPVMGGDGKFHNVPVPWVEYIPVSNSAMIRVQAADMTDREYSQAICQDSNALPTGTFFHGLVADIM